MTEDEDMRESAGRKVIAVFKAEWGMVVLTGITLGFLVGALHMKGRQGNFPFSVAVITSLFGLTEIVLACRKRWRQMQITDPPARVVGIPDDDERMLAGEALVWNSRAVLVTVWFAFSLATTYTLGIVWGSFVSTAVYFHFFTEEKIVKCVLFGAVLSLFIFVAFGKLSNLPLYKGLF